MRRVVVPPLIAACALLGAQVAVGDEPIVADRPGFGESASAVAPLHLQLESGLNWTRVDGDTTAEDAPELLLRLGSVRGLELRVAVPEWVGSTTAGQRSTGWTDTSLGLKGHLSAGGHDLSLRATAYLPSGSASQSSNRVDPELALAWSHSLGGPWSLGSTVSERWFRDVGQALTSPSLSLGRSLGAGAGTFLEYGSTFGDGVRPVHRLDHGYTWDPSPSTQIDVSLGIALSPAAPDFFVAAGFCHRF